MIGSRGRLLVDLGIANFKMKTSSGESDALAGSQTTSEKPIEILESAEVIIVDDTGGSLPIFSSSGDTCDVLTLPIESDVAAPSLFDDLLDSFEKNIVSEIEKTSNKNHEIIDCNIMKLAEEAIDSEGSLPDVDSDSGSLYQPGGSSSSSPDESESKVTEINQATEILGGELPGNKRKRKGQLNKVEWKRQKNAKLRLLGKAYVGFKKNPDTEKYEQSSVKDDRAIGSRCSGHSIKGKKGGPRQLFKCIEINDDQRDLLFRAFWAKSSWESKQTYVVENVLSEKPKYAKNKDLINPRRKNTYRFYFTVDSEKKRVCRQMFLNTLSIGEKQLKSWILKKIPPSSETNEPNNNLHCVSKDLETWLNSLPKMESHYCRSSSSQLYLEPVWSSVREMHRVYQVDNNKKISWQTFQRIYKKMNLAIYAPKKDQCNECTLYKNGTLEEEPFQKHIKKMKDANAAKEADKLIALSDKDTNCYTVDLQAVLLSPRLNAAANYYKTKLKVHNQVFYDQATRDVSCFVWHEVEGGLESDVFATIATKFIINEIGIHSSLKKIIIWSDGCGYQNRNAKLSNALLDISIKTNIIIEQKYLEVGHTHMEVDSVHSAIEAKLRNRRQVYVPADYISIIKSARINNPYKTHYLSHEDFFQYDTRIYSSIRPGSRKGDPCVNDVVSYQYTPEGIINYKLAMQDEWTELPQRTKRHLVDTERPKLYKEPRPIERSKYLHLQELKQLIPQDYRDFYTNLPYK